MCLYTRVYLCVPIHACSPLSIHECNPKPPVPVTAAVPSIPTVPCFPTSAAHCSGGEDQPPLTFSVFIYLVKPLCGQPPPTCAVTPPPRMCPTRHSGSGSPLQVAAATFLRRDAVPLAPGCPWGVPSSPHTALTALCSCHLPMDAPPHPQTGTPPLGRLGPPAPRGRLPRSCTQWLLSC